MAEVMNWAALAGNEMLFGLQYARRGPMRGIYSAGTLEQMQVNDRFALEPYPGIVGWIKRCKALPKWPERRPV